MARTASPLESRFWPKVDKKGPVPSYRPDLGPCWLWTGAHSTAGYAQTSIRMKVIYAHRIAYELLIGSIPNGYEIDHLCRVRGCINPNHLEAVTPLENLRRQREAFQSPTTCKRGHSFISENRRPTNHGRTTYCFLCRQERERNRL